MQHAPVFRMHDVYVHLARSTDRPARPTASSTKHIHVRRSHASRTSERLRERREHNELQTQMSGDVVTYAPSLPQPASAPLRVGVKQHCLQVSQCPHISIAEYLLTLHRKHRCSCSTLHPRFTSGTAHRQYRLEQVRRQLTDHWISDTNTPLNSIRSCFHNHPAYAMCYICIQVINQL